jgi:hypothetical protein
MNKRRFESTLIISMFAVILLLSSAIAVIYYTLQKQSTWKVSVGYDLALTDKNDVPVETLDFIVPFHSFTTKTFRIHNIGNNETTYVNQTMPISTVYYTFSTTFVNEILIARNGFYEFNVTLTDIGMTLGTTFNGSFSWDCVEP